MNRTGIMVGVLVVLIGIAVYVWTTSGGTEVDPTFAQAKQGFTCPHCGNAFELSGDEITSMINSDGGVVCPGCSKKIDDYVSAKSPTGELGGGYDAGGDSGDTGGDEDQPPQAVGGRQRIKR
ncbi:MAG: hypothetical protein KDA33_10280 [Phycisphaerales bacterium]|nr:hypothetical protein [Phycisphaerales bacterium]